MRELSSGNVIITCAVTGAIHTPTMSPHLPVTPEEIAQACIEASEAGAVWQWTHRMADSNPDPSPARVAVDEIAVQIGGQWY